MQLISKFSLVFLLAVVMNGCASFRGDQLGEIKGWPPSATQKKSISYVVTGKVSLNGNQADAQPPMLKSWKVPLDKAYRDSTMFSTVSEGFSETDLRAEIEILDKGEGSMVLAFIAGYSLGIIPAYGNDEFIIKTTFKDSQGNVLGRVSKQEDLSYWIQILLLPVMPFAFPSSVTHEALYDIHRATLLEAHQKGMI